jgi:glycosyltransferase involved in cell wall biosynthesis
MPLVSVLIPARNASTTLGDTLTSLVEQTFKDFEVLIVDDCSDHCLEDLADSFSNRLRIRFIRNSERMGVAKSLNKGLKLIDAKYVARIDADDIAHQTRFSSQVNVLGYYSGISGLGTSLIAFSSEGSVAKATHVMEFPPNREEIACEMIFRNSVGHPSLMIRRDFFEKHGDYDSHFEGAEDYELWTRGILESAGFMNLKEGLTFYRIHPSQVTSNNASKQLLVDLKVKQKYLYGLLGANPDTILPFVSQAVSLPNAVEVNHLFGVSIPYIRRLETRFGGQFTSLLLRGVSSAFARASRI